MQPPITIQDSTIRFAEPNDEMRHAFRHNGTPLVVGCRFLESMASRFPTPTSFVHPSTMVTRLFLPFEGRARIRAVDRDYILTDDRIYLLPVGMPFETCYHCDVLYAYHLHVYDETGGPLFDPAQGIRELCEDALRAGIIEAMAAKSDGIAEALAFAAIRRFVEPELDRLASRHLRTERFRSVIAEVEQRPSAELTVVRLAALACLSPSAASKGFRRATGVSLKRFALNGVLRRAKELLTYTDLSVTEIATQLGYGELSYFSRVFKRETGIPPVSYRNTTRGF